MSENLQKVSQDLLQMKYLRPGEKTASDILDRVAKALAEVEPKDKVFFRKLFRSALDYCILGGRINASAGVKDINPTWINCFVQPVGDSVFEDDEDGTPGIMKAVAQAAQTMRLGGGVGYNFSKIRPKGSLIKKTQSEASGPVSFMDIFNSMCGTVISSGLRRGAQMGILRCDHPDIEEFVECKKVTDFNIPYHKRPYSNFNLSVAMTDEFMNAVDKDLEFSLVHKAQPSEQQIANGAYQREDGLWVYKTIKAKELYDKIMLATYTRAEPGVVFIDTINSKNNLRYVETIEATNPCVTGDTEILTPKGPVRIDSVVDKETTIWNGFQWSEVIPKITGYDQEIYDIEFSDGSKLSCTPYHKFILNDATRVEAKYLILGSTLASYKLPNSEEYITITIKSKSLRSEKADKVYCFNEPINHSGVFNGVMTANCGEQALPPYGCCDLGHINLTKFVMSTVWDSEFPTFDWAKMGDIVYALVRMLDNVLTATPWPLEEQQIESSNKRRIGIGFTGLGDVLCMMGLNYNTAEAREFSENIMRTIRDKAYMASVSIATEKGAFPLFDAEKYLEEGTFASTLPSNIKDAIRLNGIRNSHLLSLAPTGTGSITFGNNCSSGCEPIFDLETTRYVRQKDDSRLEVKLYDYAYLKYLDAGKDPQEASKYFQTTFDLTAKDHVLMLECLAKHVDSAVSKTINLPSDYPFEDFKDIYMSAWKMGLKGITTYRPNEETGSVLVSDKDKKKQEDVIKLDTRIKLEKLPQDIKDNFRVLDTQSQSLVSPSNSHRVTCPYGDFVIHVEYSDVDNFPTDVWINGQSHPRALDVVARLISEDMKIKDIKWIEFKLNSLQKTDGMEFDTVVDSKKGVETFRSPTSVLANILKTYYNTCVLPEVEDSFVNYLLFNKEPKTTTNGTMSWSVDINNPSTRDDFTLFVKELEMPDGSTRPYSVWISGEYPRSYDGISKLLSLDMRVMDLDWVKGKLLKLRNFKEHQGDFFAFVPGERKQKNYPSTIAYIAELLLYRYEQLSLFKLSEEDKEPKHVGKKCPDCGGHTLIKYNGCDKCKNCGYIGSCG